MDIMRAGWRPSTRSQAAASVSREHRVRVGALTAVPKLLREFGLDPGRVLAEFGIGPEHFEDPDNTIAFATEGRLLSRCAALSRCPHFGLLAGQREDLSVFGALGFLVQSAPDVRSALAIAERHYRVHNPDAAIQISEDGAFVTFRYTILQKGIEGREQILDEAMAIAFNVMRSLCGHSWLPNEVLFAHARPADPIPFRQCFHAAVRFDQNETALVFSRHWLDAVPPGANRLLYKIMAERVRDIESHIGEDFVTELRRLLPSLITARGASISVVARFFGLGTRTLSRRLAEAGASFMQLREEACETLACQLLEDTCMPVNEIAYLMGYANASAFTRAFERWTGMGPAQWRKANCKRP
ncbi:MAG TPA: AraC family transcriptional regulator [Azonexus sp.]|nr:AraC family transcriptional regulator [Azonexus sp.]